VALHRQAVRDRYALIGDVDPLDNDTIAGLAEVASRGVIVALMPEVRDEESTGPVPVPVPVPVNRRLDIYEIKARLSARLPVCGRG
jgi:hypothetical protein